VVSRDDGTPVETESWSGAECSMVSSTVRCKNATGGTAKIQKTKTLNVYKLTLAVSKQTFLVSLPTIAQTPLHVTLTTPISVDRLAVATSCVPRSNFKKVVCTNP
jgi:hypothetical protein